jgi:hypothetical protein
VTRKRYTILARLNRRGEFADADEVRDFETRLWTLVQRGIVESIPVGKHRSSLDPEAWFRDRRTGHVYRYVKPDFPSRGHWGEVLEPGTPSFFESLCAELYPTQEQYRQLVRDLDRAWAAGQIECAMPREAAELVDVFFLHPASDESYDLTLANPYQKGGCWMKTFFSRKAGSWPGDLILGPPPWRQAEQPR